MLHSLTVVQAYDLLSDESTTSRSSGVWVPTVCQRRLSLTTTTVPPTARRNQLHWPEPQCTAGARRNWRIVMTFFSYLTLSDLDPW